MTMWTPRAERILRALRPRHVRDETTHELVLNKLALVASRPEAIRVTVEHACVVLTGRVPTSERPYVVRSIARVRGVDSVVDLLTEDADGQPRPGARSAAAGLAIGLGLVLLVTAAVGLNRVARA